MNTQLELTRFKKNWFQRNKECCTLPLKLEKDLQRLENIVDAYLTCVQLQLFDALNPGEKFYTKFVSKSHQKKKKKHSPKANSKRLELPSEICELIHLFSFVMYDTWDERTVDSVIQICPKINEIFTGIAYDGWQYRNAFGKQVIIAPQIKTWIIRIGGLKCKWSTECNDTNVNTKKYSNEIACHSWTVIGIIENNKIYRNMRGNFYNASNGGYALKAWDGGIFHSGNKPLHKIGRLSLRENDAVVVTLDMSQNKSKRGILTFVRERIIFGAISTESISQYVEIDKQYRFCAGLCKNSALGLWM